MAQRCAITIAGTGIPQPFVQTVFGAASQVHVRAPGSVSRAEADWRTVRRLDRVKVVAAICRHDGAVGRHQDLDPGDCVEVNSLGRELPNLLVSDHKEGESLGVDRPAVGQCGVDGI